MFSQCEPVSRTTENMIPRNSKKSNDGSICLIIRTSSIC